ncbi:CHAD domain-containing protein [Streptomyces sp. M2CJ-2]|uniref:CHAD domain-containing protein n=1 Tax=Streptomyces sp. M2CJ-2 TaxID=2803948 RepID=UPI0019254A05|nr:CHAD domain-containing protein [Streptomyces sp. M2CJ-2]MBL3668777.1 CHAD domain-containing protein [Streptomyces sp. M2CJ-2]
MAQQHLEPTDPSPLISPVPDPVTGPVPAGALAGYLRAQATEFLRALRLHREAGAGAASSEGSVEAALALRRSARRISGSLHTFQAVLDPDWSEAMRPELAWVSGTLALEHACSARLERLLLALHRLSGTGFPAQTDAGSRTGTARSAPSAAVATLAPGASARTGTRTATASGPAGTTAATAVSERGKLTVGAAKAGALLDRQLTLARTRAHSTALQALGSSRFHAVADKVAVLASEVPLIPAAGSADLRPLAEAARERLVDAVAALPLGTAGSPYNAEALMHGLSPDPAPHPQDVPWHQVRLLLRLHRYAREVLYAAEGPTGRTDRAGNHAGSTGDTAPAPPPNVGLVAAGEALDRHRDASEASAAAAHAARTPRITPATAYALGVLHADQRHDVEAARYAFQHCWQTDVVGSL